MKEFVTWELMGTFGGAVLVVGLITELLKNFRYVEKIPTQALTYILSFILLTASQLALNTFAWSVFALNVVNAAVISLASNGGYTAVTNIIKTQKIRQEEEKELHEYRVEKVLEENIPGVFEIKTGGKIATVASEAVELCDNHPVAEDLEEVSVDMTSYEDETSMDESGLTEEELRAPESKSVNIRMFT